MTNGTVNNSKLRQAIGRCSPNAAMAIASFNRQTSKRVRGKVGQALQGATAKAATHAHQAKALQLTKQSSIILSAAGTADARNDPAVEVLRVDESSEEHRETRLQASSSEQHLHFSVSASGINSAREDRPLKARRQRPKKLSADQSGSSGVFLRLKKEGDSRQTIKTGDSYHESDHGWYSSCRLAQKESQPTVQMSSREVDQPSRDKSPIGMGQQAAEGSVTERLT